ncbi:50S ribosomal protein L18 [Cerasicoccus arenae]|uniref:Large ribosomal subunit protein uL18 n=1 Tax=Cerasicoccus arenae TaxID=424488 RepID=A0A8J3DHT2_9BACT|nr:50S ribosomal protein L18 [Cerasicoccus arenae]MBK1857346.1 50S ribosomal protein L18 [Cerasicoccus arenae]GHC08898.1 50S ribosomal protein L18 [Cerasicoccus arenae]
MKLSEKLRVNLQKRRWRIRKRAVGDALRPRLVVTFTNQHIHAQCINDVEQRTLVSASTLSKDLREQSLKPNTTGASTLGKLIGERAKAVGVEKVVFDRAGRRYHGCVKAFADAAREAGLNF